MRRRRFGQVGRGRRQCALARRRARIEDNADREFVARGPADRVIRPPVAARPDKHRLQTRAGLVAARTQLEHEVVRQRLVQHQVQAAAVFDQPQHGVVLVREAEVARRQRALLDPACIAGHRRRGRGEHADRQLAGPDRHCLLGQRLNRLLERLFDRLLGCGRGVGADEVAAPAQAGGVARLDPVVVARFGLHLTVGVGGGGAAGVLDQHLKHTHRAQITVAAQDQVAADRRVARVVPAQTDRIVADLRAQALRPLWRLEAGRLRQRNRGQDRRQDGRPHSRQQPAEATPGPPVVRCSHARLPQTGATRYTVNMSARSGSGGSPVSLCEPFIRSDETPRRTRLARRWRRGRGRVAGAEDAVESVFRLLRALGVKLHAEGFHGSGVGPAQALCQPGEASPSPQHRRRQARDPGRPRAHRLAGGLVSPNPPIEA